jgi:hypothetical protein
MSSLFLPKSNLNVALLARPPALGSVAHASLQSHFSTFDPLSFPDKLSLEAGIIHALRTHGCATGVLPRPLQLTTSVSVLAHLLSPSTTPRPSPHRHPAPAPPAIHSPLSPPTRSAPKNLLSDFVKDATLSAAASAPLPQEHDEDGFEAFSTRPDTASYPSPTHQLVLSQQTAVSNHIQADLSAFRSAFPLSFHQAAERFLLAALPLRLMSPSPSQPPTRCSFTPT